MNAAVRAVARAGIAQGAEVIAIERGYEGLLEDEFRRLALWRRWWHPRSRRHVSWHLSFGTIQDAEGLEEAVRILEERGIGDLVVVGGDGSYRGANALHELGIGAVGVPATIDNDVAGTDTAIGFDTALNTIADAVGKVRDTASSHERTFVIEVMGRRAASSRPTPASLAAPTASSFPRFPTTLTTSALRSRQGIARGKRHSIIVMAEGAGHAFKLAEEVGGECGHEVRAVVLGHVQRGGSPSAFDRILASRMGERAVWRSPRARAAWRWVCCGAHTVTYPLQEAYAAQHLLRKEIYDLAGILAR